MHYLMDYSRRSFSEIEFLAVSRSKLWRAPQRTTGKLQRSPDPLAGVINGTEGEVKEGKKNRVGIRERGN